MKERGTNGPKYVLNIEGEEKSWDQATITTEEIISLGGWDSAMGALEVNLKDNSERPLSPGENVEIKPGYGFSKKVGFKRGSNG